MDSPEPFFVTYLRTKIVFHNRLRDLDKRDRVKVYLYELKKLGVTGELLYDLRKRGFIWYNDIGEFGVLRSGPIDPKSLDVTRRWERKQGKMEPVHYYMREILQFVTLSSDVSEQQLPVYFQAFLKYRKSNIDVFFSVDGFSGRVHTPIVNLKGILRRQIYLDNKKICELDVKQMQPLILAKVLYEAVGVNAFSSAVFAGIDVYLLLLDFNKDITTREEAKKFLFQLIFGKPMTDIARAFKGDTNWVEWINSFKSRVIPANPHSRDMHTNLAWLLQTQEVSIMSAVWKNLMDLKIKFLSVHDAVLMKEDDKLTAFNVLKAELTKHFPKYEITTETY
jgi:hypothetical protein